MDDGTTLEIVDSPHTGTQTPPAAPTTPYTTKVVKGTPPMNNYFNKNIISNHEHLMYLNNSMAECYDFCLRVAEEFNNESDMYWWYEQKKGHLCYDV